MAKPNGSLKKIQTTDNVDHEIIPDRLGNGSYVAGLPTMTKDDTLALLGKANTFTEKQTFSSTTASSFTVSPTTNESISGSANNSKLVPSSWVRTNFQTKLPTTTTAGKVLKSTSTAGEFEWGDAGGSTTIDDTLSTTSENPVQNKVITGALNDKLPKTWRVGSGASSGANGWYKFMSVTLNYTYSDCTFIVAVENEYTGDYYSGRAGIFSFYIRRDDTSSISTSSSKIRLLTADWNGNTDGAVAGVINGNSIDLYLAVYGSGYSHANVTLLSFVRGNNGTETSITYETYSSTSGSSISANLTCMRRTDFLYGGAPSVNTAFELDTRRYNKFHFYVKSSSNEWIAYEFSSEFLKSETSYDERLYLNASSQNSGRWYVFTVQYTSGSSNMLTFRCTNNDGTYYLKIYGEV